MMQSPDTDTPNIRGKPVTITEVRISQVQCRYESGDLVTVPCLLVKIEEEWHWVPFDEDFAVGFVVKAVQACLEMKSPHNLVFAIGLMAVVSAAIDAHKTEEQKPT